MKKKVHPTGNRKRRPCLDGGGRFRSQRSRDGGEYRIVKKSAGLDRKEGFGRESALSLLEVLEGFGRSRGIES